MKAYQPSPSPLIFSSGNFARAFRVTWMPSTMPSTTIVTSATVQNRLSSRCASGNGSTSEATTMMASGMNRPLRCGRESTRSRT